MVVGDIMLDHNYWGEVNRISPEAPVPVFKVMNKTNTLGGAGNVSLNIIGLNAQCILLGVAGNDTSANLLGKLLDKTNILYNLVKIPGRPTTTKTRITTR